MNNRKNIIIILMISIIISLLPLKENLVLAATDYPVQEMEIATLDGYKLAVSGNQDGSLLKVVSGNGEQNERWKFTYVNGGYFKLVNQDTGRLISTTSWTVSSNAKCITYGDANKQEQCWIIEGVDKDSLGNYITYKIKNYKDSSMVLTSNGVDKQVTLTKYTGADNQKWRLNSAGLEGFAGYSKSMDGKYKAGTIGGVLGETVMVSTFDEFQKYSLGDDSRTIVITKDIVKNSLTKVKVGKNKTIIGAYGVSLTNLYFYLDQTCNSGNLIMKNLQIKHSDTINENNDIPIYISVGTNFWIDHCTLEGHDLTKNTSLHSKDVDKLIYVGVKADYITVSNSKFTGHKYGLILGYPSDDESAKATYTGYPRMTISNNFFKDVQTRAPGLMRYGYFHSYNNYIESAKLGYTSCTNANIYSEKNYFNNCKNNGLVDDYGTGYFTDEGSYPTVTASKSKATSWRPKNNYTYNTMQTNKLREYAEKYAGAQNSKTKINYSTYKSPGVQSSNYVVTSKTSSNTSNTTTSSDLIDGGIYYIKNVNSNKYLDVYNGIYKNNTNVQQHPGNGEKAQRFKVVSAGNGYYKLVSQVGNADKVLDVSKKSNKNGANIAIYSDNSGENQKFKITSLGNGKYTIATKISKGKSVVEVKDGSTAKKANVQQWESNGHRCQQWKFELVK
ncbi:RICIN domain-containing protein [Clostridium bornimense]|uniref:pectate lyase family protein n=1 Tax=Clostridium bornimense TaxID=1216932 RepID=UPI001C117981|nr:RICIN domain-containing protein [Clostridium bornimense]MBU5317455.1 RICIN domain-containing protein [Clostridium bornimense]